MEETDQIDRASDAEEDMGEPMHLVAIKCPACPDPARRCSECVNPNVVLVLR